jgi:methylmalonyl-CoA mutase N-terminal domain/subunit
MKPEPVQLPLPGFDREYADWSERYEAQIGADRVARNRSGIEVRPLYTPGDWNGSRYLEDLGFPGKAPYTRGIYPTMHRGAGASGN